MDHSTQLNSLAELMDTHQVVRPPAWWEKLMSSAEILRGLRVGVYGSGGAPFHHAALLALWQCTPVPVRAEDIRSGALEELDVLIFPGGGLTAMAGMLGPLGIDGARAVTDWVAAGGMYLGSCAGSFLPAALGEGYWEAHEEARQLYMVSAGLANGSDSAFEGLTSPGVGTLEVTVSDHDHWLVEGLPDRFELVHYNGPLFDLTAGHPEVAHGDARFSEPEGVLVPAAATANFTPSEAFLGTGTTEAGEVLLQRCIARGAYNGVTARFGEGLVVLFGSHPEFGFDALQLGWGPGVQLLANALCRQAERRHGSSAKFGDTAALRMEGDTTELRAALSDISDALARVARAFLELRDADTGGWLKTGQAPAFLGRTPEQLWREATDTAARVADESSALSRRLAREDADLCPALHWIDDPALPNQDFGFMGLRQLVMRIEAALEEARGQLKTDPTPLAHAYDGFDTNPYQIAASSYLSAAGLTAAALLATITIAAIAGLTEAVPLEMLLRPGKET